MFREVGEVGDVGDGYRVEWTPVARRMEVAGKGWRVVAEDDGGLVFRGFVGGAWRTLRASSARAACTESY